MSTTYRERHQYVKHHMQARMLESLQRQTHALYSQGGHRQLDASQEYHALLTWAIVRIAPDSMIMRITPRYV